MSEHDPAESRDEWLSTVGEVGVFGAASFLTEEETAGRGRSAAAISSTHAYSCGEPRQARARDSAKRKVRCEETHSRQM